MKKIPVSRPYLTGKEKVYVADAMDTAWISSAGQYINKFETLFAEFVGCEQGVACTNGTAAVYLALQAAGVQAGDRVVVPSFTMMASVFPIVLLRAEPVFVDCEPDTWNIDIGMLKKVEGPVKAVMVVHIYGHPCDMDPICDWAREHAALVIEDAAEAHGALYKDRKVGNLGDIAAFSFYSNKVITTGEGGMVTTSNIAMADRARSYRNLCFDPDPAKRFIHEDIGFNFRMTNLQAAIGLAQTESADKLVDMRRRMAGKYLERLTGLDDFIQLPVEKPWAKNVYWMFGIVLREELSIDAEDMVAKLATKGVDTRRFFYPAHLQPCLAMYCDRVQAPVSEGLWERGLYLPSAADLTDEEADYVCETICSVLKN